VTESHAAAPGAASTEPPERSPGQVWRLGARVVLVQVVTLVLLWLVQATFAAG
jgi:hypothetical protein